MIKLLTQLKNAEQDFEWYPTTDEMLQAVARHCGDIYSLLDVGAVVFNKSVPSVVSVNSVAETNR
jgi:hypothetical protein